MGSLLNGLNLNLKCCKQNVKISNIYSTFDMLLSGVQQGSLWGSVVFNVFLMYL